jgi:hypothetical protein
LEAPAGWLTLMSIAAHLLGGVARQRLLQHIGRYQLGLADAGEMRADVIGKPARPGLA